MRLFVGLSLPPELCQRLALAAGGVPEARWVAPDSMHLTLAFIGEVDGAAANDACEALDRVWGEPFDLALHGVGTFAQGTRPNVLWAGVRDSAALMQLQERIATALRRTGIAIEERKFAPHVTLAWLKADPGPRLGAWLADHALMGSEPWTVRQFHLYSSHLGSGPAIYRIEASFDLAEDAGEADDGDFRLESDD
ncbi:RNA 2',3'-cyclic phosphodiesterase [Zavarzinia sp. CC-PAN008]|uniref:RNA 2',3'-cyclic phosphodiesterase n=1 Tax=Zavarzinia sp. CC-PAN008 TaxID=3243332 RepID=UPI003F7445BC